MRDSKGNKIDLNAKRAEWEDKRLSPSLYLTSKEAQLFTEDLGKLVKKLDDGTEIRRHAYILSECRGGTKKIVCNKVIVGNPVAYAEYEEEVKRIGWKEAGWMAKWNYDYDKNYESIMLRFEKVKSSVGGRMVPRT